MQVRWANGTLQHLRPTSAGQLTVIYKPTGETRPPGLPRPFWEATNETILTHQQEAINDFKIQPLLPYMLSPAGLCFAVGDVNGDDREDVFIGGGRGQGGRVLLGGNSGFTRMPQPSLLTDQAYNDVSAEWADIDGDTDLDLLVGSAGYELPVDDAHLQTRLYLNNGRGHLTKAPSFPDVRVSASCVRVADIGGDGDRDVFIGARVVPARYPEIPVSHLLLNDGRGHFSDITSQQSLLSRLGMVTDAAFADLTRDGHPELIVATDFGPVQAFTYQRGSLQPLVNGLPSATGCWNQLLVKDLDNDGNPDIVAANAGLNSQLRATPGQPLLLYGVTSPTGSLLPVLAGYDRNTKTNKKPYPFNARDELLDQLVPLRKKFTNYISYAKATITDLFSPDELAKAQKLNATDRQTVLFRNIGHTGPNPNFVLQPLPIEAQFSPVCALTAIDVNQDGLPDLIIGGNRELNRVRLGKEDANRGQLFLNQGKGWFAYVPMAQSGLLWAGDVRDLVTMRVADRTELLVGITGQPVRLFSLNNPNHRSDK